MLKQNKSAGQVKKLNLLLYHNVVPDNIETQIEYFYMEHQEARKNEETDSIQ